MTSLSTSMTASEAHPLVIAQSDYDVVRRVLAFISNHWRQQPELDEIAEHVGLSPNHVRLLFQRWAGLSPKGFLQAVTLDHARRLLDDSASLLDTALEVGLSGPGRLHDLFVTHEALSPGEYKAKGRGLTLSYGFHPSPFGESIIVTTHRGLAGLGFVDGDDRQAALQDMQRRWPQAELRENHQQTAAFAERAFAPTRWQADNPLRVVLIGSDFEVQVWESLLKIPVGQATTYSTIAEHIGKPKAARAVGAAVGRNPVSFVVPCHRVLGRSGALTGYHWGIPRKQAMLGWEAGQIGADA
jgi:AraC family transcriptional regulator of adaptative response/methylated-DNA-[protein]-cysteine methyltransferase